MEGSLKVQTEYTGYQGPLDGGVPGHSIYRLIATDTYMDWYPSQDFNEALFSPLHLIITKVEV
jgi:hypothetical protein